MTSDKRMNGNTLGLFVRPYEIVTLRLIPA